MLVRWQSVFTVISHDMVTLDAAMVSVFNDRGGRRHFGFSRSKSHLGKAVALCELRHLIERHALPHNFGVGAVQNLLRIPPPDSFPLLVGVYLESIQHHNHTGWTAVRRILLCGELFRQLEVVLEAP